MKNKMIAQFCKLVKNKEITAVQMYMLMSMTNDDIIGLLIKADTGEYSEIDQKKIADEIGLSYTTFKENLMKLQNLGFITKPSDMEKAFNGKTRKYRFDGLNRRLAIDYFIREEFKDEEL